ncbi:MAG TPA: hypothetical protein VI485_25460 [Vicinamibacterales bacterium]|nr:hypothetical protein [Vicinamibacterales bacterium]
MPAPRLAYILGEILELEGPEAARILGISAAGTTLRWPFLASSIESDDSRTCSELRRCIAPRPMQIRDLSCSNGFRRL